MTIVADLDAMRLRLVRARKAFLKTVVIALIAVVARGMLIQPSIGIPDVHLPPNIDLPVTGHALGDAIGQIPRAIALLLQIGAVATGGLLIWALVKRRTELAKLCLLFILVKTVVGPIPVLTVSPAPAAIDVATAERLVGPVSAATSAEPVWKRYIVAQMAYVKGDRATARRLSVGLDGEELGSRREAVYRVGILQGHEPKTTNVCLIYGCLPPLALAQARTAVVAVAALAAVAAAFASALYLMLRARLERIDGLRTTIRARSVPQ